MVYCKCIKVKLMKMEERVILQTRLRNLTRKYAKIKEHAELGETAIELKADIDSLERKLNSQ